MKKKVISTLCLSAMVASMAFAFGGPTGPSHAPEERSNYKIKSCRWDKYWKCAGYGSDCIRKENPCEVVDW